MFVSFKQILYQVVERVATVTLNRPDRLNAWTPLMEEEVRAAMTEAETDDQVRVIVLTGAGRGFCAGADMKNLDAVAGGHPWAEQMEKVVGGRSQEFSRADVLPDFRKTYSY